MPYFFRKIRKDVARFAICCSSVWRFKGKNMLYWSIYSGTCNNFQNKFKSKSYKRKYVHEVQVNRLVKLAQEKGVVR